MMITLLVTLWSVYQSELPLPANVRSGKSDFLNAVVSSDGTRLLLTAKDRNTGLNTVYETETNRIAWSELITGPKLRVLSMIPETNYCVIRHDSQKVICYKVKAKAGQAIQLLKPLYRVHGLIDQILFSRKTRSFWGAASNGQVFKLDKTLARRGTLPVLMNVRYIDLRQSTGQAIVVRLQYGEGNDGLIELQNIHEKRKHRVLSKSTLALAVKSSLDGRSVVFKDSEDMMVKRMTMNGKVGAVLSKGGWPLGFDKNGSLIILGESGGLFRVPAQRSKTD